MISFFWIVTILFVILLIAQWTVFFCVRNYIFARPKFRISLRHVAFFLLSVVANLLVAFLSVNASWAGPESLLRQSLSVSYFFYLGLCLALFLFFLALGCVYLALEMATAGYRAGRSISGINGRREVSQDCGPSSKVQDPARQCSFAGESNFTMSRRAFMRYTASTGTLAIVGLGSYGLLEGYEAPKVDVIQFSSRSLEGLTRPINIIQITDLHFGMFFGASALKDLVKKLNSLEADALVITGDLFHSPTTPVESAAPILKNLRDRRWGNFAVLGNHDFYAGVQRSVKAIQDAGIRLIRNEWVTFNEDGVSINMGGIDDPGVNWLTGREFPKFQAFMNALHEEPGFRILLSHRPVVFPLAAKENIDLTLSGHTHGGQITFPVPWSSRPWSLAGFFSPYTLGLYESGRSRMYLNRGVGLTFVPTRINCPPEIAIIRLTPPELTGERSIVSRVGDMSHGTESSKV